MSQMSPFERAVLEVLNGAAKPFGWYNIEVRLSNMDLDARPHLPAVLSGLRDLGFVMESRHPDEPTIRYSITQAGRDAL